MEDEIRADRKRFKVKSIAYDPWQMAQMAGHFEKEKAPMHEFRQTAGNYSEVMLALEELVTSGRFHHDNNPVLTWAISNVVAHKSGRNKEYIQPTKEKEDKKIDPAVALLMALSRAILAAEPKKSVYEERGVRVI
jgi:phage terminase large subunit-like protein